MTRTLWRAAALQLRTSPVLTVAALALTASSGSMAGAGAWLTKLLIDELGRPAPDRAAALLLGVCMAATGGLAMAMTQGTHYINVVVRRQVALVVDRSLFSAVARLDGLAPFEDPAFHARLRLAEEAAEHAPQQVMDLIQAILRTVVTVVTLTGAVWVVSPGLAGVIGVSGGVCGGTDATTPCKWA